MKVEPIKNKESIKKILENLSASPRNKLLFALGTFTGFRISDLLKLKLRDITGKKISILEQKTRKRKNSKLRTVKVIPLLKEIIEETTKHLTPEDYLFKSQKSKEPMTRHQAYRILNKYLKHLNINIGTHTMRKTYGYWHYKINKDIISLQQDFNHDSPYTTMLYIGMGEEARDKAMDKIQRAFE